MGVGKGRNNEQRVRGFLWGYCLLLLGLFLPFQNCSQPTEFRRVDTTSIDSASNLSGGEGYGGKLYEIVSETDTCGKGEVPAAIKVDTTLKAFLVIRDCKTLAQPEAIEVIYSEEDPSLLMYNGQIYQDVMATTEAPNISGDNLVLAVEVENMDRVPSDSSVQGDDLVILDNDYVSHTFSLSADGYYHFVIRARGNIVEDTGSIFEVYIDGTLIGHSTASDIGADYWFGSSATAGSHEITIQFINDYYSSGTADRNLYLDILRVAH